MYMNAIAGIEMPMMRISAIHSARLNVGQQLEASGTASQRHIAVYQVSSERWSHVQLQGTRFAVHCLD